MKNTIIFRQAIRRAMATSGATCARTYTDKVKTRTPHPNAPKGFYHTYNSGIKKVCFYQVRVPCKMQAQFIQDVTEAGGYITGEWSVPGSGVLHCNVRGVIQPK